MPNKRVIIKLRENSTSLPGSVQLLPNEEKEVELTDHIMSLYENRLIFLKEIEQPKQGRKGKTAKMTT